MAIRAYFIPITKIIFDGGGSHNCPKYFWHRFNPEPPLAGLESVTHSWETYLLEDVGLIVADVDNVTHTLLAGQLDVLALPLNLDGTITLAAVNTVKNFLEAVNVPAGWVTNGMTYRAALRTLLNIWQLHSRYVGTVGKKLFGGSIHLNDTVADIPQRYRDDLRAAAESMGLDFSAITPATTIRQLLKGVADQLGNIEYKIGPLAI